jgi:hypothetical protein
VQSLRVQTRSPDLNFRIRVHKQKADQTDGHWLKVKFYLYNVSDGVVIGRRLGKPVPLNI